MSSPATWALRRGEEMGWFEHGSTIIVFAPRGAVLSEGVQRGRPHQMGQALMRIDRIERLTQALGRRMRAAVLEALLVLQ